MKVLTINRRQFLVGAGGFTLALPFLGSLVTSRTKAGEPPYTPNPRFVCFTSNHGGIWFPNMYPSDATLTESGSIFSDHAYRHGALALETRDGRAFLSPVLSASTDRLTSSLVEKMMVVRGCDITFYINHHTGGYLGNFARNDTEGSLGLEYIPTIDQIMAWSPTFYPDVAGIRVRSMHVGNGISWGFSNPSAGTGSVQAMPGSQSSADLFSRIFTPGETPTTETPEVTRTPVVDRVYEHYDSVRNGVFGDASRLSAEDKRRLDDHMDRLAELERRVGSGGSGAGPVAALCTADLTPARSVDIYDPGVQYETRNVDASIAYYQTYNDVIAAAFICGSSRIATVAIAEHLSTDARSWHTDVAHRGHIQPGSQNPGEELPQTTLLNAQQKLFEHIFLDLAQKLDVEEANGITFLENSLLMWTQESSNITHNSESMPIVTAGSAGGWFQTGRFYDYRNVDNRVLADEGGYVPAEDRRPGLTYNQWLANVLQSMNVPPAQYERDGLPGYGLHYRGDPGAAAWPDRIYDMASDPLPGIRRVT
jgi:hypothetical protein